MGAAVLDAALASEAIACSCARSADGRSVAARVRVVHMIRGEAPTFVSVAGAATPSLCGQPPNIGAVLDVAGRFGGAGRSEVNICGMAPLDPYPRSGSSPK